VVLSETTIAVAFVLAPVLAIMLIICLALLFIYAENAREAQAAREEQRKREAELAGLKASYTDPKREIVV
jgi:hypothetical protein